MAEAEDSGQPGLPEAPIISYRAGTSPEKRQARRATVRRARRRAVPLDPDDPELWMTPSEAAERLRTASGNVLDLDAAARKLELAAEDRQVTCLQQLRGSAEALGYELLA